MSALDSTVGWTEISPAALRKMRAELEIKEQGVLDEMGVGALHAGYADAFFPGTSVLQTRARYLLFVPWTYLWVARQRSNPENARALKERAEKWLTGKLRQTENRGVIGTDVYPDAPAQPADVAYWSALRRYRLYDGGASRAQLIARWDRRRILRREDIRRGEEDTNATPLGCFDVPPVPEWWMDSDQEVRFQLETKEAEMLRDRFADLDPPCLLGMAARLLRKSRHPKGGSFWDDGFMAEAAGALDAQHGGAAGALPSAAAAIARARGASASAEMVRAVYAALVEDLHEEDLKQAGRPLPEDACAYREHLRSYWEGGAGATVAEAAALDIPGLAGDIALPGALRPLLEHVQARLRSIRTGKSAAARLLDSETRELFTRIERRRKGARARLPERDGRARREDFGSGTVTVGGIDFRYRVARQLLQDVHGGLFQ